MSPYLRRMQRRLPEAAERASIVFAWTGCLSVMLLPILIRTSVSPEHLDVIVLSGALIPAVLEAINTLTVRVFHV